MHIVLIELNLKRYGIHPVKDYAVGVRVPEYLSNSLHQFRSASSQPHSIIEGIIEHKHNLKMADDYLGAHI